MAINMTRCEVNEGLMSRFSKCKGDSIGRCVYCGRLFCRAHGEILEEQQEICSRKNCVAKRDDLAVHLVYKGVVVGRNEEGACGIPKCANRPDGQCARCRAFFCTPHLQSREEIVNEGRAQIAKMTTMCAHCWDRRPIWTRM